MNLTVCKVHDGPAAARRDGLALVSGMAAPLVFAALVLAAAAEYPGYNHLTQAISELAGPDAPSPWLQTINFFVAGMLMTMFGYGLGKGPGGPAAGLLIAAFGSAIVIQGLAPCDVGCNFVTATGTVHNIAGLAGFVAAIAAIAVHGARAPEGWYRRYSRISAGAALAGFVSWIVAAKIAAIPAANGSLQRLFVGVLLLWCAVTAARELRRTTVALVMLLMTPVIGSAQPVAAVAASFTPATPASVLSFMLVVASVIGAFIWATYFAHRREGGTAAAQRATWRFVAGVAAWLALFSIFVGSGLVQARPMPFIPIAFMVVIVVAMSFALSSAGTRLARHTPIEALVAFQGFRLPLELVLHAWSEQGTIPTSMSWTGSNFDVVTGITALVLAPFARWPAAAWTANLTGLILLANVARTALLSSPVPFGWPVEPKLMLIAHLPYAYVGAVCVAGAVAGHVILTRRLLGRR